MTQLIRPPRADASPRTAPPSERELLRRRLREMIIRNETQRRQRPK